MFNKLIESFKEDKLINTSKVIIYLSLIFIIFFRYICNVWLYFIKKIISYNYIYIICCNIFFFVTTLY